MDAGTSCGTRAEEYAVAIATLLRQKRELEHKLHEIYQLSRYGTCGGEQGMRDALYRITDITRKR